MALEGEQFRRANSPNIRPFLKRFGNFACLTGQSP